MSASEGATVPYHLRPHKAVDRRLFVDLLGRFERWKDLSDYVYVSMGAYALEDHKLVHRLLGLSGLIAFDMDAEVVARQKFNRPIDDCHCKQYTSGEVAEQLQSVLTDCKFETDSNVIVWFDYTRANEIGVQVGEFKTLLGKLNVGDIVRVTVNAHPYAEHESDEDKIVRQERRYRWLKRDLGELLPPGTKASHLTTDGLPKVLARIFGAAALEAVPVRSGRKFVPLSIVRYADGQQMLSITGTIIERTDENKLVECMRLREWPFASIDWLSVHQLVVPHLTLRERLFLERGVHRQSIESFISELGFTTASGLELKEFIKHYKKYYRFYPTLLPAEV